MKKLISEWRKAETVKRAELAMLATQTGIAIAMLTLLVVA